MDSTSYNVAPIVSSRRSVNPEVVDVEDGILSISHEGLYADEVTNPRTSGSSSSKNSTSSLSNDAAARVFVGLSLQERNSWIQRAVQVAGIHAKEHSQVVTLFLTSKSLGYISSFFRAAAKGTADSI